MVVEPCIVMACCPDIDPMYLAVVGNISVGGNGKTPPVIWLAEMLREAGYRPGIVSRGYGGQAKQYPLRSPDVDRTGVRG